MLRQQRLDCSDISQMAEVPNPLVRSSAEAASPGQTVPAQAAPACNAPLRRKARPPSGQSLDIRPGPGNPSHFPI